MNVQNKLQNNPVSYHVLLVEEDEKAVEFYSDLIRQVADCKIDVMSQFGNFFEWMGKSNYHLIIISGAHPGLDLLEQIKRVSPSTSVVVISENATVEQAVEAIRLGAEDYLSKPFKLDAFQYSIKRGLDRKKVFEENSGAQQFLHLLNSCQLISASLEQNKIFEVVQTYLTQELNAAFSAIYSLHDQEPIRVDHLEVSENHDRTFDEVLDIALRTSNPLPSMLSANENYRFVQRGKLTPSLFVFRFQCAGQSDYFCVCLSPETPSPIEEFESRLRLLKAQIEVTGKNIEQYMGVQQLVYVDDATGLYNTRYLHYILDREIAHSCVIHKSFAVLFIDADRFKQVNDQYGHLIGTKLLNELGNHLKKYVREKDTIFRYGGDEFVAVLFPSDLDTARSVAERIRESVEKKEFLSNERLSIHFTVSIGVALFPDHALNQTQIIEAADRAMYHAKRTTRNSISIAEIPVVQKQTKGKTWV
jgi:two-component system cell cycle response regulator